MARKTTDRRMSEELIAKIEVASDKTWERADTWYRRFALSLGVANGAAFAGVASRIIEGKGDWLLGPAWLFMIGLLAAGFMPWLHAWAGRVQNRRLLDMQEGLDRHGLAGGPSPQSEVEINAYVREFRRIREAERFADKMTWFSAACFVLGTMGPLLGMTIRALSGAI